MKANHYAGCGLLRLLTVLAFLIAGSLTVARAAGTAPLLLIESLDDQIDPDKSAKSLNRVP